MNDETRHSGSEPTQPQNNPPHDDVQLQALLALIPAYSIGATDVEETRFVEANLATYPNAVADLVHYQQMSEGLLHSAGLMSPPPALRGKILSAVSGKRWPQSTGDGSFGSQVVQFMNIRRWSLSKIVAAAAILMLVASNLFWWTQVQDARQDKDDVAMQLEEREVFLAALNNAANTRWVELSTVDTEGAANAAAAVIWEPTSQRALLYAQGFPPLEPNMAYQLWLIQGDQRISAGVFQVNFSGNGTFVFTVPESLSNYDALGVTPEPATGSPAPTGNPVVFGEL
jgi:anti-sigma-K factor RskA